MTKIEKLIRDYDLAWGSGDANDLLALITDDFVHEDMGLMEVFRGKDEIKEHYEETFDEYGDFAGETIRVFETADGKWAASEGRMVGSELVETPSGEKVRKSFSIPTANIYELEGGLIKRHSCYYDNSVFLRLEGKVLEDD